MCGVSQFDEIRKDVGAMTPLEKLKARIGKAEAEYAAARKGSQARLRAGKELEAALKDTIHQNERLAWYCHTTRRTCRRQSEEKSRSVRARASSAVGRSARGTKRREEIN